MSVDFDEVVISVVMNEGVEAVHRPLNSLYETIILIETFTFVKLVKQG